MLIIGFGSRARQGKDTAAEAVVDYYENKAHQFSMHGLKPVARAQRVGFADALYEVCKNEYNMIVKDAPLLQRIGAQRREQDPDYWIKRAFAKVNKQTDILVIPDCRYKNEVKFIKAQGGYLVNVQRLNPDGTAFITTDRPSDHPSETDLDGYAWDFYLKTTEGHAALTAQMAVCLVEYLRSLHN